MSERTVTHVGFADESHWNTGRFRSLGLVTTSVAELDSLNPNLRKLLAESGVREFKWKALNGAKERFAAQKLCDFAVQKACEGVLRVDVLVWDIEDSRHKVPLRDDIANLQRMYYHLFRNVLRLRWPKDAVWRLHPDEHTAMEWETIQDCLESVGARVEPERSLFTQGLFRLRLEREFSIEEIRPVVSSEHPLLQLADLFAGMAVFSREKYPEYQEWLQKNSPQLSMFDSDNLRDPSSRDRERYQVIKKFNEECKKHRLGVSLKGRRGFFTFNPKNPINFWFYEPQSTEDKAPVRTQQKKG